MGDDDVAAPVHAGFDADRRSVILLAADQACGEESVEHRLRHFAQGAFERAVAPCQPACLKQSGQAGDHRHSGHRHADQTGGLQRCAGSDLAGSGKACTARRRPSERVQGVRHTQSARGIVGRGGLANVAALLTHAERETPLGGDGGAVGSGGEGEEVLLVERDRGIEAKPTKPALDQVGIAVRNAFKRAKTARNGADVAHGHRAAIIERAPIECAHQSIGKPVAARLHGGKVPDVGDLVRRVRIDTDCPPAHLVGQHERGGVAGEHKAVERGRVPPLAQQRLRADQNAHVAAHEQSGHDAGEVGAVARRGLQLRVAGARLHCGVADGGARDAEIGADCVERRQCTVRHDHQTARQDAEPVGHPARAAQALKDRHHTQLRRLERRFGRARQLARADVVG